MKSHLAIAALTLLPLAASAETFRCGKWIVGDETTREDLLHKCGEPTSRDTRVEDVRSPNQYTGGKMKVGETVIETWTYARGNGAAPMVVIIIDGKVKSIERKKK